MGLASLFRFHGRTSLRFVYRNGKTVRSGPISLKYAPNSRLSQYRAAVVVSRSVSKSAVVRNRIRRRVYEIVRRQPDIKAPYDLVFTVFSAELAKTPSKNLEKTVKKLLKEANITN